MRVLVTGHHGFIGSAITPMLVDAGHEVVGLDTFYFEGCDLYPDRLAIDPGLGFSKRAEHNWQLLHRLHELLAFGFPVLVGASRKRFLGALLGAGPDEPRPAADRDDATVAVTTLAAAAGAWCVRVHDVRPNADAVRVVKRWTDG